MANEDEEERFFDSVAAQNATEPTDAIQRMQLTRDDTAQRIERRAGVIAPATSNAHPPATQGGAIATVTRSGNTNEVSRVAKSQHRRSYQETIPAIPAIPARYLKQGSRASTNVISRANTGDGGQHKEVSREESIAIWTAADNEPQRGRTGQPANEARRVAHRESSQLPTTPHAKDRVERARSVASLRDRSTARARQKSLQALTGGIGAGTGSAHKRERAQEDTGTEDMARTGRARNEDLFLELAHDDQEEEDAPRPISRGERAMSRLSQVAKRRSLPAESILTSSAERRPKSSGTVFPRSASRLEALQNHANQYRSSDERTSLPPVDTMSVSGRSVSARAKRYSNAHATVLSAGTEDMPSSDMPSFGRRRPSYGSQALHNQTHNNRTQHHQGNSPADSSEAKKSNGASTNSVDSDTADTVWDELDELKSRIKKLEFTGKIPPTSGAAISGSSSERPRTATTAPTTIDSSPKVERKSEPEIRPMQRQNENTTGGPAAANIHPLLHSALAKAKPLLNALLYRSLEATAADALQLAALSGSAGPQGTTFSAASIINGLTVSDRHVRRKADSMCRNLTDLTLALCEGKHEAISITASPITFDPVRGSPMIRYSRNSIGRDESVDRGISRSRSRPLSRLEARRSSILGIGAGSSINGDTSHESAEEGPDSTPPHTQPQLRRLSRASSRLLNVRAPHYDEVSGDEDPTVRPPSRAMTDIGGFRSKIHSSREYNSPGQDSSPSFRDALAARRTNGSAFESNRELTRVASLHTNSDRRRWTKESTPPVLEEETNDQGEYTPSSQPRRRITSLGQFGSRRAAEHSNRAASLSQRRHIAVAE
ncbi:hypothetical protein LTR78_005381 [Recurvomyces mirabilis]|uniref:Uncharacterized protein n=1 Tax=Recurvomyces mirabilis TaxID=574656 RepID=A0AAE0WMU7_9PEZI|nr:hypothetical protein LTR78_005381 [Recurvomyces mirabilis]KAK5152712.1 hypothetical protein LTS14_008246 [Recurvomyces mirabilis]